MMIGKGIFARTLILWLFTYEETAEVVAAFSPSLLKQKSLDVLLQRRPSRHALLLTKQDKDNAEGEEKNQSNPFRFFLHPYESKIPAELRHEIMQAEAQTVAAQNRSQRVLMYAALACLGVLAAFFNGFLSELRSSNPTVDAALVQRVIQDSITYSDNALNVQDFTFDLQTAGFGWVESNIVTKFLLLNKIGGAVCLLGGAAAGLLAEAELDTRRINAEKIYEEMVRRRQDREKREGRASSNSRAGNNANSNEPKQRKKKNKGLSGKERKRIDALTEVVDVMADRATEHDDAATTPTAVVAAETAAAVKEEEPPPPKKPDSGGVGGSVLDTIKGFYERADSMAASQALLLNKKLEDAGVLEKITDETGLNVIGKEKAAAVIAASKNTNSDNKDSDSQVKAKD